MGDINTQNSEIQKILAAGVPQSYIDANPQYRNGNWIDPQDTPKYISAWQASNPTPSTSTSNIPTLNDLAGQSYQFDPNQYLPGIQATASSIYDPQKASLDALSKLSQSQYEQNTIKTQDQFAKTLKAEIESINARGAFFGGGALDREADVRKQENYAITDLTLQNQASQAGFLAQQAGLSAAQAEYIQQKLTGAENSAYSRWQDNRNFLLSLTTEQRREMESDRAFNEDVRQFGLEYALKKKAAKKKK